MRLSEQYMHRCVQLAKLGKQSVSPNPMVGCVIVHQGVIIGEGYHRQHGEEHAEVHAIKSVKKADLLPHATLYVSLEPCAHFGKTPPCCDLIIAKGIKQVVVGCIDSYAEVAGKGIEKMRQAGITVQVGMCEEACLALIRSFRTYHEQKRPYLILKWAQSQDGFMDSIRAGGSPIIFSNRFTKMAVHKLRAEVDAIMVGTNTALQDNPMLNVRDWSGSNPLRVVLDRTLRLPLDLHLFNPEKNTQPAIPTLVFTAQKPDTDSPLVSYQVIDFSHQVIPQLLDTLYKKRVQTLLVEGGSQLLHGFVNAGLWDEIQVEIAPIELQTGIPAPPLPFGGVKSQVLSAEVIRFEQALKPNHGLPQGSQPNQQRL